MSCSAYRKNLTNMTGRYVGILFQYKSGFTGSSGKTWHFAFLVSYYSHQKEKIC